MKNKNYNREEHGDYIDEVENKRKELYNMGMTTFVLYGNRYNSIVK